MCGRQYKEYDPDCLTMINGRSLIQAIVVVSVGATQHGEQGSCRTTCLQTLLPSAHHRGPPFYLAKWTPLLLEVTQVRACSC
ncbi:hypothetical protein U0070_009846 [Myodes glareolus]|uniref:Uncharacterized protein n=1 Tax=Myodes glareolus TaxID=447135 RepID=A0AAW0GXB7_MYOGA